MAIQVFHFDLIAEPRNGEYEALLRLSRAACVRFSLIQRLGSGTGFGPSAQRVLDDLKPHLAVERQVSEWPGTRLLDDVACLREYQVSHESIGLLMRATSGLYEWRQPERPEDLILWRDSAHPWLVSIAHERDSWLLATRAEYDQLIAAAPELRLLLKEKRGE